MGDLIGVAVSGTLYYVPAGEYNRILALQITDIEKTDLFAAMCRINTLYMIARAGSGHIGSSFSSIDIMSWVMLNEIQPSGKTDAGKNFFFSSKGHDAPALYSVLIGLNKLNFELIHKLRKIDGLPGHPDVSTPNIITNTGSLGMGISKAKGMITANRLQGLSGNFYVLTGDGELQEGQIWESLVSACNSKMQELTVIVDHNKLQSDTLVAKVSDLGDLEIKFKSFGWFVVRCNGHDLNAFSTALEETKKVTDKPKVIIADTIKGCGVSFMQHTAIDSDVEFYKFHSGAPSDEAYSKAAQELINQLNNRCKDLAIEAITLEQVVKPRVNPVGNQQRLIPAYSDALLKQAEKKPLLVVLNADLILDTGLFPFQEKYPDRFIECGIAEQDMVSQAGGMALFGLLPIVHSFACFLTARPNEQIYNNSTEKKKIIYVGSLAGVLPGGPGHSHQGIRDIATMGSIPGLIAVEPSNPEEVKLLLDWCIDKADGPCYIRLNSLPWEIKYAQTKLEDIVLGHGQVLKEGGFIAIISHGPAMLSVSVAVADKLFEEHAVSAKVINLPWLNYVDLDWLTSVTRNCKFLVTIEDHFQIGGQSDAIAKAISSDFSNQLKFTSISVKGIPIGGANQEVLAHEGLDSVSVLNKIKSIVGLV